jgi:hypothetical protein
MKHCFRINWSVLGLCELWANASSLGQQDSKHYDDGDSALTLDVELCGSKEEQDRDREPALNLQSLSTAGPPTLSYDAESSLMTNSQLWKTSSTTAYPSLTSPAWNCTGKGRPVCYRDAINQPLNTPPRTPVDRITPCTSPDYSYNNTPRYRKTYADEGRRNVQRQNVPFVVRYIPVIRSCRTPQPPLASYQWRAQNQATLPFYSRCYERQSIDPHATRGQSPCPKQQSRCCSADLVGTIVFETLALMLQTNL